MELEAAVALGRTGSLPDSVLVALDGAVECGPPPAAVGLPVAPTRGWSSQPSVRGPIRARGWLDVLLPALHPSMRSGKPHYGSV